MDFSHLNKILEKSFAHIKKDILSLKDGQKKNLDKIKNIYDDFHKEIKISVNGLNEGTAKKKEVAELNARLSKISSDLDDIDAHTVSKKELNNKFLPIYHTVKSEKETKKKVEEISKRIEDLNRKTSIILRSNEHLEESKVNVESIKNMIKKEVERNLFLVLDKVEKIQQLENQIKSTNQNVSKIKSETKNLVTKNDHNKAAGNIKRQTDLLVSEINRIEAETVKNAEHGGVKARISNAENRIKHIATFKSDAKDIKQKLAKFTRNLDKLNEKLALDKKKLAEEEKKIELKAKAAEKKAKQKPKKQAKKSSSKKGEEVLFKKAIDSVIEYFTETPQEKKKVKTAVKKKSIKKKAVKKKSKKTAKRNK